MHNFLLVCSCIKNENVNKIVRGLKKSEEEKHEKGS